MYSKAIPTYKAHRIALENEIRKELGTKDIQQWHERFSHLGQEAHYDKPIDVILDVLSFVSDHVS